VRNLGDAFLAQPQGVMDSVQRLRAAAQKAGNLSTNEQIKVSSQAAPAPSSSTVVVQQAAPPAQVIVIEPAQPQVVYVPGRRHHGWPSRAGGWEGRSAAKSSAGCSFDCFVPNQ